jgi:hypothetical protein
MSQDILIWMARSCRHDHIHKSKIWIREENVQCQGITQKILNHINVAQHKRKETISLIIFHQELLRKILSLFPQKIITKIFFINISIIICYFSNSDFNNTKKIKNLVMFIFPLL